MNLLSRNILIVLWNKEALLSEVGQILHFKYFSGRHFVGPNKNKFLQERKNPILRFDFQKKIRRTFRDSGTW